MPLKDNHFKFSEAIKYNSTGVDIKIHRTTEITLSTIMYLDVSMYHLKCKKKCDGTTGP